MIDRIFALFLMALAAFIGGYGLTFDVPFSYDPLGPKAFPVALGALLFVLSFIVFLKPADIKAGSKSSILRGIFFIGILVFYQLSFNLLGFLVSTTITVYFIAKLFKGRTLQSIITAVCISFSVYVIFDVILKIPLPLGKIIEKMVG
ncbi:MAG: putative tricarboxylic transport rane protein [Deferribacteres bacterium]|jgi:putative tricarboxylic transport membrane protein|nr:tricarboxylate transport protein TctB [Deferribacteraceae bacterium]MDK2793127.1 putative tricarboxylic transport rane protein [Deferribacteres bacterium]